MAWCACHIKTSCGVHAPDRFRYVWGSNGAHALVLAECLSRINKHAEAALADAVYGLRFHGLARGTPVLDAGAADALRRAAKAGRPVNAQCSMGAAQAAAHVRLDVRHMNLVEDMNG